MSKMNLKPAYRFRFLDTVRGMAVFFGIMVIIMAGTAGSIYYAAEHGARVSGSFTAFGVSAAIAMLVTGICTIREDLRLMLQNGVGRHTIFAAELLAIGSISLLLAAAGELLIAVIQAVTSGWDNLYMTDIFQLVFFNEMGEDLTFAAHIQSTICFAGLYACTNLAGMFISLVFYRLNKMWTIVVAVGVPLFAFVGLPFLGAWNLIPAWLGEAAAGLIRFSLTNPWTMLITLVVTGAVIAVFNWLMLRRAPVKPVK